MGTKHLSNDEFLTRLTTLLSTIHTSAHGSIFLTQKPLSESSASPASPSTSTPQIIIRATNGKSLAHRKRGEKEKLSTIVTVDGAEEFYRRYAEVCKKGMEGLRKRVRKGRKKGRKAGGTKEGGGGGKNGS